MIIMGEQNITPELIEKARHAKNIKELENISVEAGLNYSHEQIEEFAAKLGIFDNGKLSDANLENAVGGRATIGGQDIECADARICKAIGLSYDPSWQKDIQEDGREIWQVPYGIYEEALNKFTDKK